MSVDDSQVRIPDEMGKELRSHLASIGIKLTLASEQLKSALDTIQAQEIRDHILRLKAEAKEIVEQYELAKSRVGKDAASSAAPPRQGDGVLVFAESDDGRFGDSSRGPGAPPMATIYDQAEALAHEQNQLVLEISELSLPKSSGGAGPGEPAPAGAGLVFDSLSSSLNLMTEASGPTAVPMGISRGGRIGQALAWTVDITGGQTLFGGYIPVLALQLATVALVLEYGGDEDTVIAAAVDAAADTANSATALVQIKQIFGADVAELVEWTSWLKQIDPWEQRDRAWTKTILEAPPRAIIVGVCWRMASLEMLSRRYRSGGTGALERAGRERDRLLWIHRALAKAFRSVETAPLIDAWELVISDLERRKDSAS